MEPIHFDNDVPAPYQPVSALQQAVEGKRVIVIGNSESLFKQTLGAKIDQFDIVIRMNMGRVRKADKQGSRTDILFSSANKLSADEIQQWFAPQLVVWGTPKREHMPDLSSLSDKTTMHPIAVWEQLYQQIEPARPSTGLIALNFLANHCNCAELAYTGFDFFQSDTFYHRKKFWFFRRKRKTAMPHSGDQERNFIEALCTAGKLKELI